MDRWPRQTPRERELEGRRFARMIVIWAVAPHPSSAEWKSFNTRATQLRIGALHRGLELYRKYITDEHGDIYGKDYLERKGLLTLCGFYNENVKHFQPDGGHKNPILDQKSISNCAWNIDELDEIAQKSVTSEMNSRPGTVSTGSSWQAASQHLSPQNHDGYRATSDSLAKPQGNYLSSRPYEPNDTKRRRISDNGKGNSDPW